MKNERSYRKLFWTLALVGLLLDQGTKYGVFAWLYEGKPEGSYSVIPGVFQFVAHYSETGAPQVNNGALFGLGGHRDETLAHRFFIGLSNVFNGLLEKLGRVGNPLDGAMTANGCFAAISLAAASAIVIWSTRPSTSRDRFLCAALGLILAGTLGNFYDRVMFQGVRDFLHFYWIQWPVFNIADCCLVCGAGLLLIQAFWAQPIHVNAPQPQPEMGLAPKA